MCNISRYLSALSLFVTFTAMLFVGGAQQAMAQSLVTACEADITQDGVVDLSDYSILVVNFLKTSLSNPRADIDGDGVVDLTDYGFIVRYFLQECVPTDPGPITSSNEWVQFGHDAQRTSFTSQAVAEPWHLAWQWNASDANGKKQDSHLSVPNLVQPITGGSNVYIVAENAVYALRKSNGQQVWQRGGVGNLSATPVYHGGKLYLPSGDGKLYMLNADTGNVEKQFNAGNALNMSGLLTDSAVIVISDNGTVFSIDPTTLTENWRHNANATASTPVTFSAARNSLIFVTQDLYVHSLNASTGQQNWRVKPTNRTYQSGTLGATGAQAERGWPVVADQHGVVFVRYRLDWNTLWTWNPYPNTNAEIRQNLQSNQSQQVLFALDITNGQLKFIPSVGNGGAGDGGSLPMGPQPIVKKEGNTEVAYIIWRNGLTCASASWCDGREDAAMGEMVLDNTTVSGYQAGDVRFIKYQDIQTDEMLYISMSGNTIFHNHWLIAAAETITDRSASRGATFANPIVTKHAPFTIWRQCYCPASNPQCNPITYPGGSGTTSCPVNCPFNASTHYCSGGLFSYGDQRGYPAGFYEYHNDMPAESSASFSVVSDGLVIIKAKDGGLLAYTGNSSAQVQDTGISSQVAGIQSSIESPVAQSGVIEVPFDEAGEHVGQIITAVGTIQSVVDHRPKAMYLGFTDPHDGNLLVRVFEKDIAKFGYDLNSLLGKEVKVTGFVSLYWPDLVDPEIIITDPAQIEF